MELITTEETGTKTGRQIRAIPPRTNQAIEPALAHMQVAGRAEQNRIGNVAKHQYTSSSQPLYVAKANGVTPNFRRHKPLQFSFPPLRANLFLT